MEAKHVADSKIEMIHQVRPEHLNGAGTFD